MIETTEDFMARQFRARVAVLVPDTTGTLVSPTGRGMTNPFDSTAAQWAYDQAQPAGAGTDTLAGNEYLFLPLKSPTRTRGVLAVRPSARATSSFPSSATSSRSSRPWSPPRSSACTTSTWRATRCSWRASRAAT